MDIIIIILLRLFLLHVAGPFPPRIIQYDRLFTLAV